MKSKNFKNTVTDIGIDLDAIKNRKVPPPDENKDLPDEKTVISTLITAKNKSLKTEETPASPEDSTDMSINNTYSEQFHITSDNTKNQGGTDTTLEQQPVPPVQQSATITSPVIDIDEQLKYKMFRSKILIHPIRDIRNDENVHIVDVLEEEFNYYAGYKPSDSFIGNIAFKLLKQVHNYHPNFRERVWNELRPKMQKTNNALERQQLLESFILQLLDEMIQKQ